MLQAFGTGTTNDHQRCCKGRTQGATPAGHVAHPVAMFVANPTVGAATSVFLDDDWLIGRRYTGAVHGEEGGATLAVGSGGFLRVFFCMLCFWSWGSLCAVFLRFETIRARWWRKTRETIDLIVDTCQALSDGIKESDPPEDAQRRSVNLRAYT